jgi:Cu-Zn family superoxide dismutase
MVTLLKLTGLQQVYIRYIHEKSDYSAADGSSAGGHWNPFKKHGKWGVGEYHKGDIGNFTITNETDNPGDTDGGGDIGSGDPMKDI